jgi:hypothetical protein
VTLAVIADIHANRLALEAVLDDIARRQRDWLAALPPTRAIGDDIFLCHGRTGGGPRTRPAPSVRM